MVETAQIGLIGLGVMGANLARNLASHDFKTVVYNRTTETMEAFVEQFGSESLWGEKKLEDFAKSLERPRKIILMVKAGKAVDAVIEQLTPLLEEGDVLIDCGNSNFQETFRRERALKDKGFHFMGCGVSGGEEGARCGPSMMPGGSKDSWMAVQNFFEAIAARDFNDKPCVTHVGPDAAGHYVKMVHNGIEYAVMQIMAEGYDILRSVYKLSPPEIADVFSRYQSGRLQSYLFEISLEVLQKEDEFEEGYLLDHILDRAGQKGTGRWTVIDAYERGVALPSIAEAVTARIISGQKDRRIALNEHYKNPERHASIPIESFEALLEKAFYSAIVCAYAQGYELIQTASEEHNWDIDLAEISRIWEGGCIIRAQLLNTFHKAYLGQKESLHLFEISEIAELLQAASIDFRKVVAYASENGVPIPALSTSLAYFDMITTGKGSANFIQGLRDYFGAHTYERNDREGTFHTEWNPPND